MSSALYTNRSTFRLIAVFALVFALLGVLAPRVASADEISGLQPVIVKYGHYSLSIDGVGIMSEESTGTVEIEKPEGATVEAAYLITGSMVSSYGSATIEGVTTTPTYTARPTETGVNTFAEVTDVVSETLNSAPAGLVTVTITEPASVAIDGDILAVVWNDPGQVVDTSIVLAFGAIGPYTENGTSFTVALEDPVDTSEPNLAATMSLGISFSYQASDNYNQYTLVDVNGQRLSSSAGGQDDNQGTYDLTTLLTVGGTGDSTANPPDPTQLPTGDPRYDDELYDLKPFISSGDTQLTVTAESWDNLFFAGFELVGLHARALHAAPVIAADQASVTVSEGQTATMTGTASDPSSDALTLSASIGTVIDDGDGTWSWSYPTTDGPDENQTVTISANNGQVTSTATFDLAILNVAPSMTSVSGPPGPIDAGVAASFGGTFTDPGTGDTHSATWDWGDGTTSTNAVTGTSVSGSHVFTTGGYYTVQLTLTDDDGGSVTTTYKYVTVIDRDAGWLTIAGDFQSLQGAWTERPSVTASASIDVLAGYVGDSPTGRLTFTLGGSSRTAAALSLRATGFDHLVMGDDTAWLQGIGTLNGKRGYAFRLTATDGPGINAHDGVRIRIWEIATGTVVYDNQPGEEPLSSAAQPLNRGLVSVGGFSFR